MKKIRNKFCFLLAVSLLFFSFSIAFAGEIRPSPVGGGIGSALTNGATIDKDLGVTKEEIPQFQSGLIPQANIQASQLVGIYVLDSFIVNFDSGLVMESKDYQFTGDMAITSNNTAWQRIAISGYPTITASGTFSISGNTLIVYNDLYAVTTVLNFNWDGTFLTTETRITSVADPFTEIDVWKRVLSPSSSSPADQDKDGVIDEWDECPNTSFPCVNNRGCKCTTFNPAIPSLLLDEQ